MNENNLISIASLFNTEGDTIKVEQLGEGFINDTFIASTDKRRYILQRKNSNIFKNIPGMMDNIFKVTTHLKKKILAMGGDPMRESLTVIAAKDGKLFVEDSSGFWTMTLYIEDTITYDRVTTVELAKKGGMGIGRFQAMLSDFDKELVDTLPGFHNIRFRYGQWDSSLKIDAAGRVGSLQKEIEWIESRREEMLSFYSLVESGEIPTRVTHNDTKISNILFDKNGNALCVIDLDTVLRAPCLYDFGDAIRTYANSGREDDINTDNVFINKNVYNSVCDGYFYETKMFLTDTEKRYLPFSARYIIYEQVLRFLMDYIDGDTYYKIKSPDHNLIRTRAQYKLLCSMEELLKTL